MKQKSSARKRHARTKTVQRLPDLEHVKSAVLNSLNPADTKRRYRHAIDDLVDWYCSEPRLALRAPALWSNGTRFIHCGELRRAGRRWRGERATGRREVR